MGSKAALFVPPSPVRRALRKIIDVVLGRLPTGRILAKVPLLPRFYTRLLMARRDHTGLHSGIYGSYREALAAIPASRLAGWDHEDSSTLWLDQIDPVKLSTYPIFFWLQRLFGPGSRLVDAGGSIGLTYYGYRRYASMPAGSTWTVVEVAKICEQGIKIARREAATDLHFASDLREVTGCDILLCAGALQFMEHSLPGLMDSLPNQPTYVLLNKLPVTSQEDCWTLQNYGPAVAPHHLFNERQFLDYFVQHGYRLRDRWDVQDLDCLIPFYPQHFIRQFSGFLFELSH